MKVMGHVAHAIESCDIVRYRDYLAHIFVIRYFACSYLYTGILFLIFFLHASSINCPAMQNILRNPARSICWPWVEYILTEFFVRRLFSSLSYFSSLLLYRAFAVL